MQGTTPPVVFYLPDADMAFGGAVNTLWGLQLSGYVPPMLVVGIGYRVNEVSETFTLRSRDLTPSIDEALVKQTGWMAGGAQQFLQFIKGELKPWVAGRFGVDPDDDVFFGETTALPTGCYGVLRWIGPAMSGLGQQPSEDFLGGRPCRHFAGEAAGVLLV